MKNRGLAYAASAGILVRNADALHFEVKFIHVRFELFSIFSLVYQEKHS